MRRIFHPRRSLHSIEDSQMAGNLSPNHHRIYRRQKSPTIMTGNSLSNLIEKQKSKVRIVRIRMNFIRIGDIDTLNEKYHADVYYEARWTDRINPDTLGLTPQQQTQLMNETRSIRFGFIPVTQWSPQLFIENAIRQIDEQEKYFTVKKVVIGSHETVPSALVKVEICEHRRLRGDFWEKLELYHFPADVQDLTISITTQHDRGHVLLVQDENHLSTINREAFFDQQEWSLYEHVATETRETKEDYSFEDETSIEQKKHSVLSVTCRAARQPGYYYWNGFCLIFLITVCAFCIFSIPPDLPQNRLQITCTLLLTSVTFRWVVNRSLPTISYLTTLDKYAIISIVILVLLCVWHSIIAAMVFLNTGPKKGAIGPTDTYVLIDRYVFIVLIVFYIFIHIALVIWLILVPYKRRREMEALDDEYNRELRLKLNAPGNSGKSNHFQRRPSGFRRSSLTTSDRSMSKKPYMQSPKSTGDVLMISNAMTSVPIREEPKDKMTSNIELTEQDDRFYDHTNDINNELKNTRLQPIHETEHI